MTACAHDGAWRLSDQPHYQVCEACGTYRSLRAEWPEVLYEVDYWSHARGHSTLAEQAYNVGELLVGGTTKVDLVLSLLAEGGPREAALEVGCAPGTVASRLEALFERVVGVEVDPAIEDELRSVSGFRGELLFGVFPGPCGVEWFNSGTFDVVVATDVFEHSLRPEAFLAECARLLRRDGQLLLMTPVVGLQVPLDDRMFSAEEHVYLPSLPWLLELAVDVGLRHERWVTWTSGHELFDLRRTS